MEMHKKVLLAIGEIIGYAAILTGLTITILLLQTIFADLIHL